MAAHDEDDEYFGEEPVVLDDSFANVVVVDNIPRVTMAKFEKLFGVIRKVFSNFGEVQEGSLYIPVETVSGEDGKEFEQTCGFAFIEYKDAEGAREAVKKGDKKKLDKSHTLRVNLYRDFAKYESVPDRFEAKEEDYKAKDNTPTWLLDETGREQIVVRQGDETEVHWNDPLHRANENGLEHVYSGEDLKERGKQWTNLIVRWSTRGTYLATFHMQGIALWGGERFQEMGRFSHPGVKLIDFSPMENYVVTCNPQYPDSPECIIVWDVHTGKKLRAFDGGSVASWPAFHWSHDEKYIARIAKKKTTGDDVISVYQVPDMGLLDKKSIKATGVREIQWSPSDNVIAYWTPSKETQPASAALISIPSREQIAQKHLYRVTDVKMHWHNRGDYLCVKMTRHVSKKHFTSNFEIFRMRGKDVPVETLETTDRITAFAWEPNGHRFAMISEDGPRTNVSFYQLKKKKLALQNKLLDKSCNCLFWSPAGTTIILASLGGTGGNLEWVNADSGETLASREHFMCSDVQWDSVGRYVLTSVTQPLDSSEGWRHSMENGYRVWTGDGKGAGVWVCTTNQPLDQCYQVMWRPRPPTVLPRERERDLRKTIKDTPHWKAFEREDEEAKASASGAATRQRHDWRKAWKEYRAECAKAYAEDAHVRRDLRDGLVSDDEDDFVETVVESEVVVSSATEIVHDT